MPSKDLREAAKEAVELAERLAELFRESDVPLAHADEVLERLKVLLADPEAPENHDE